MNLDRACLNADVEMWMLRYVRMMRGALNTVVEIAMVPKLLM